MSGSDFISHINDWKLAIEDESNNNNSSNESYKFWHILLISNLSFKAKSNIFYQTQSHLHQLSVRNTSQILTLISNGLITDKFIS